MTAFSEHSQRRIPQLSSTKLLTTYFVVGVLGTLFDAYSSWQIISVNPIAIEGNPIWGTIAAGLGFGGAMIFRAAIGILMLLALWGIGNQKKRMGARRVARFGLRIAGIIFVLLTIYHVVGTLYFQS